MRFVRASKRERREVGGEASPSQRAKGDHTKPRRPALVATTLRELRVRHASAQFGLWPSLDEACE